MYVMTAMRKIRQIRKGVNKMKLNEYLFKKIVKIQNARPSDRPQMYPSGIYFTKDEVEKWIVDWYRMSFKEIGCDGSIPKSRMPPSWLAIWKRDELE